MGLFPKKIFCSLNKSPWAYFRVKTENRAIEIYEYLVK
jgi:hypothetical protein